MANHKSALKRQRQSEKRNTRNRAVRKDLKIISKKLVAETSKASAVTTLTEAISKIHKAAKKGVIHKNAANRKISRLAKRVNALKVA